MDVWIKTREMDYKSLVVFAATSVFMVSLTYHLGYYGKCPFFCGASCTDVGIGKNTYSQDKSFLSLLTEA